MKKIKYPITRPYITKRTEYRISEVIKSGWLTQGKYVQECENKIKKYTGSRHAFMVNSATSGLIAAVMSLGLNKKDEVICPSFTFPATANAIVLSGAIPVFCDIDLNSFNISVKKIEKIINRRTKAIMPVSEFGLPVDMPSIIKITKKYRLRIVEDSACALGSSIEKKKIGAFGDMGVFSFHPRKIITSGEGGCVITNNRYLASRIEELRNHGIRKGKFLECGFNFRMSDIQGAVIYDQILNFGNILSKRINLAENYNGLLQPLEKKGYLKIPSCPKEYRHSYQSYVILLRQEIDRDKVKNLLANKGIETQFGTYCVPMINFYRKNFNIKKDCYTNSYIAYRKTLVLPLYHKLKQEDQEYIVDSLKSILKIA